MELSWRCIWFIQLTVLAFWSRSTFETCQSLRVERICSCLSYSKHERFIAKYEYELCSKSPKPSGSMSSCQSSLISAGKCEKQEVQVNISCCVGLLHSMIQSTGKKAGDEILSKLLHEEMLDLLEAMQLTNHTASLWSLKISLHRENNHMYPWFSRLRTGFLVHKLLLLMAWNVHSRFAKEDVLSPMCV